MSKITDYFPPLPLLEAFPVPGCVAAGVPTVQKESMVKRQKSLSSRDLIVEKYKSDLKNVWIDHPTTISTWFGPITMHCKVIDDTNLPVGFTKTAEGKYQYNFTDPELTDKKRYRPIAYRMSFLLDPNFYNSDYTVSHLCHNPLCYNWEHHVLETLETNKSRNGCPGGPHCHHIVKCLIPGPFSES